jgi:hypothetical protein
MVKKLMRLKVQVLFASVPFLLGVMLSLPGCSGDTKIEGWNDKLISTLGRRYMLAIEKDFTFIDGYYDNAFQDNSVYLTFKVPNTEIGSFYNAEHYEEKSGRIFGDDYFEGYTKRLDYDGELYTWLCFYDSDDEGYTLVKFHGRYPGAIEIGPKVTSPNPVYG